MAYTDYEMPLIEEIEVKNYRALHRLHLKQLEPLSAFIGPNGGGKSTLLDVFAFLAECFEDGLTQAWERRGGFRHLRTRGTTGPIALTIKWRERRNTTLMTYHLTIDEKDHRPVVSRELLKWKRGSHSTGSHYWFINFREGSGRLISGEDEDARIEATLESPDLLAISTFGHLTDHSRINHLLQFVKSWHVPQLNVDTAGSLARVIQCLEQQHPDRFREIQRALVARVPQLERIAVERTDEGRPFLQFKDAAFDQPLPARFTSTGTLNLLAYLTILNGSEPPKILGIETPENDLHPRLLYEFAEECRMATLRTQTLLTTHSPSLLNALGPKEVWVIERNEEGYTEAKRASEIMGVKEHKDAGAQLGSLWTEGYLEGSTRF